MRGRATTAAAAAVVALAVARAVRHRNGAAAPGATRGRSWLADLLDPYPGVPGDTLAVPPLPRGEMIQVPGRGEVFVRRMEGGSGVPVLLLHGWMASADTNWFRLFPKLGAHHPVVAVDHRGHGRGIRAPTRFSLEECADDAAGVLRYLGIERAVVVGYSMGGPIAALLWQRHPDLVSGLVLQATALHWRDDWLDDLRWRLMGAVALLLRFPAGRYLLARALGGRRQLPPEVIPHRAWAEGEFRRGDPSEMAEAGRALARFDGRPFARDIDVPTAVVVTTEDPLVPPPRQRMLAEALGARVFEIAADHAAPGLRAEEFARVTLAAIEAVSGS